VEFDAGFLIFLFIFFVLPLLQRILGGGKQQQPPGGRPGQRPPARVPPPQRRPLPDARERTPTATQPSPASRPSAETSDADRAAQLIPAELWEILTGERRMPAPQRPVPPTPSPEADLDEELAQDEEAAAARSAVDEDRAAAELLRRRERDTERDRLVVRAPVQIVSLETEPLAEPARHAAFHREVATLPAAVVARQTRPRPALLPSLDNRTDLMRAIVLQEVLGRPKGLD
jgi:hypothetical protein